MSPWRKILAALLLILGLADGLRGAESRAERVIILANANDPGSLAVAQHYAALRRVPRENIIAQPMSQDETITWPDFIATVWQPLQDELIRRKWIDAGPETTSDDVGRKQSAISGHHISYLVICRGVPLRIASAPELSKLRPPPFDRPELRTNEGAVDSELSLLAQTDYPIDGYVPNPLYHNDHPTAGELAKVVKVARLDGPTVAEALALVDHALAAEHTGLLGRAYVDLSGREPNGDRWLELAAAQLAELGFDLDVDRAPATFPLAARFDAPVFYFGWYAGDITGPFTLPAFQFPPGAIAVHIHSFSAATLRSDRAGWCGPLVARGVTATVGNVFEPYLGFLHRPDFLLEALVRGETFGDAAYYAEPVLSWQAIAIGDPLYRPFARSFEEQWQDRAKLPPRLAGYAALRKMHLLAGRNRAVEALSTGHAAEAVQPSLALGLTLARCWEQVCDLTSAAHELAVGDQLLALHPDEWALAREAAQLLLRAGAPAKAELLYTRLLRDETVPRELREGWLREAGQAALAAGDHPQAREWAKELGRLDPEERK